MLEQLSHGRVNTKRQNFGTIKANVDNDKVWSWQTKEYIFKTLFTQWKDYDKNNNEND